VINTTLDRCHYNLDCFLLTQILLILRFHNCHGSETSRTESQIRKSIHITIVADFNKLWTFHVITTYDKVSTNMPTILECVLRKSARSHLNSVFSVSVQSVKLEFTLYHFCNVITISGSTGTATENVWSQVMNLLAVFVPNHTATCCSCVCSERDSILHKFG